MFEIDTVTLEEVIFPYIGYAAALATILAFAIQTVRILRSENVSSLSSYMYTMFSLGLICWFAYGVYIESWILAVSNLITFFFTFSILCLILYYDAEDKIERARRDQETGLYNRKYFFEAVPEKAARSAGAKQNYTVMLLSFNNYDRIFKEYGRRTGRKALRTLSKFLDKALRNNDMVARIDKNLFAAYIDNCDEENGKNVASRLDNGIRLLKLNARGGKEITFDTAAGLYSARNIIPVEEMLGKSAEALDETTARSRIKIYKAAAKKKSVSPKTAAGLKKKTPHTKSK